MLFADNTPQGCVTCDWGSVLQDGVCYPHCEESRYYSQSVSADDRVCVWKFMPSFVVASDQLLLFLSKDENH